MKPPVSSPLPTDVGSLAGRQFSYLLRHGRYSFTKRELQEHLQMTYRTIKQCAADPSGLTVAADLLAVPVQEVLAAALADAQMARAAA